MENTTNLTVVNYSENMNFDCNEVTNNGLYLLFVGYLWPLLWPKIRNYGDQLILNFRNCGKVTSDVVSLTEFGFEKIQDLKNNDEMIKFIQRYCDKKKIELLPTQISDISWNFSGDNKNGSIEEKEETWNKLLKKINDFKSLNKVDGINKP